jgi:hypothetical protein
LPENFTATYRSVSFWWTTSALPGDVLFDRLSEVVAGRDADEDLRLLSGRGCGRVSLR